jgi:hypothetical protein
VADILAATADAYFQARGGVVSSAKRRVVRDLVRCRTAALGGHVERCDQCGHEQISYNSCRNRHCPKCQAQARAEWMEARAQDLLPVEYFHVVFTVPPPVAAIALHNKKTLYDLLFRAAQETLQQVAADPKHLGADIGFLAVLHTWTQTLLHHPHLHCVVPGGGLSADGTRWIACPAGFFLPVKVLSRVFRGKFLDLTQRAFDQGHLRFQGELHHLEEPAQFRAHLQHAFDHDWVVYCKRPFGGPTQVLKYLARYTHRVAISNRRLLSFRAGRVRFRYRDSAHGNRPRVMDLEATEFVRRFLLHVLPHRFVRIRHYGLFANTHRREKIAACRALLAADPPPPADHTAPEHRDLFHQCPVCRLATMIRIRVVPPTVHQHALAVQPAGIDSS